MGERRDDQAVEDPGPRCANEPAPASPFAPEPRPSIGHLMIWAACVAVYMSAYFTLRSGREAEPVEGARALILGLSSLVSGAYLMGLPLSFFRWMRHQTFPRYGGEFLWLMGTISVLQGLGFQLVFFAFENRYVVYQLLRAGIGLFIWTPYCLYAARVCRGRWRAYFLFCLIAGFAWYSLENFLQPFSGQSALFVGLLTYTVIVTLVLSLVAGIDYFAARPRYPWPHWAGILLAFVYNAVALLWYGYYLVTHILGVST